MITPGPNDDLDDDSLEIELRPLEETGKRLVLLAAIAACALLELELLEDDDDPEDIEEREGTLFDLRNWAESEGLLALATPAEAAFLRRDLGAGEESDLTPPSESYLSIAAIGWATGLIEEPWDAVTEEAIGKAVDRIPEPWDEIGPFIDSLRCRSLEEIANERERTELWHWRSMIERDRRSAKGAERRGIEKTIAEVLAEGREFGILPVTDADDFVWKGKPVDMLTVPENQELEADAAIALHALNWLCGYGDDWENVPLEI
jgi:hypothetical protein